jgi:hypothetical protein
VVADGALPFGVEALDLVGAAEVPADRLGALVEVDDGIVLGHGRNAATPRPWRANVDRPLVSH